MLNLFALVLDNMLGGESVVLDGTRVVCLIPRKMYNVAVADGYNMVGFDRALAMVTSDPANKPYAWPKLGYGMTLTPTIQ